MNLRTFVPNAAIDWIRQRQTAKWIKDHPPVTLDGANLISTSARELAGIFSSATLNAAWAEVEAQLAPLWFHDSDISLGVNPGDQRAIWYMVRHWQPRRFLEIGTNVGSSMAAILSAQASYGGTLSTVDIVDVNDPATHMAKDTPASIAGKLNARDRVVFHTMPSTAFFARSQEIFDAILLDGDHALTTTYAEIPLALSRLAPGGVIIMHDFFPGAKPLWPGSAPITGPFLALKLLQEQGLAAHAIPLGDLPWPTKLGTHTTSLAVLSSK